VMVEAWVVVVPTSTLPKFSVDGATESCPTVVVLDPVPLNGMLRFGPLMKTFPPVVLADCGANVMLNVMLCPAARTIGKGGPLTEKSLFPVFWNPEIFSFQERALVNTTESD